MELKKIEIEALMIPVENSYNDSNDDIDILKANIKRVGLQTPITVYEASDGKYNIISGSRRYRAIVKIHGEDPKAFNKVPCYVVSEPETIVEKRDFVAGNNFYTRSKSKENALREFMVIVDGCNQMKKNNTYSKAMSEIDLLTSENAQNSQQNKFYKKICDSTILEFQEAYLNKGISYDVLVAVSELNPTQQKELYEINYEDISALTIEDLDEFSDRWGSEDIELDESKIVIDETGGPKYTPPTYKKASFSDFIGTSKEWDKKIEPLVKTVHKESSVGIAPLDELNKKYVEKGDSSELSKIDEESFFESETEDSIEKFDFFKETENQEEKKSSQMVMVRKSLFSKSKKMIDFYMVATSLYMNEKSKEVDFSIRQNLKKQLDTVFKSLKYIIDNFCDDEDLKKAESQTGLKLSDLGSI